MTTGLTLAKKHKKFEINWIKIKGSCHSGRKVVTHDSKSNLPLLAFLRWKRFLNFLLLAGPECAEPRSH